MGKTIKPSEGTKEFYAIIYKETYGSERDGLGGYDYGETVDVIEEFETELDLIDWIKTNATSFNAKKFRAIIARPLEVETEIVVKAKIK